MTDAPSDNEVGPELRIGRLSSGQVEDAGRILAQAFLDEKMFSYLLCDDRDKRLRATVPVFGALVRAHLPYGGVHSAMLGDKLVAVAVRLPPEHNPLRGRENLRFNLRIMPAMLRLLTRCRGARHLIRIIGEFDRIKPQDKPYWYMIAIGVEPEYQGQGIGTRLTQETLDRADAAGVGCYFETAGERTKAIYLKRGFSVLEEIEPMPGGPMVWTMWREPQKH
jgi:GNAT superfamily N-acetyltransferase